MPPPKVWPRTDTENTLLNAVVGATASAALSFTRISPFLGGAVAG